MQQTAESSQADRPNPTRGAVLLKQYELLTEDIRTLMTTNDRLMHVGFTVLGAGYALGVGRNVKEVLTILPFFAFSMVLYTLFVYTNVLALGGHKRFIEEQINEELGAPTLLWERVVERVLYGNMPSVLLALVYTTVLVVACIVGENAMLSLFGETAALVNAYRFSLLLLWAGGALSAYRMSQAYARAYRLSAQAIARPPAPGLPEAFAWRTMASRLASLLPRARVPMPAAVDRGDSGAAVPLATTPSRDSGPPPSFR